MYLALGEEVLHLLECFMVHELERLMSPFPYPTQSKHCPSLLEFLESQGAGKGADQGHTERQQAGQHLVLVWMSASPP